MGGWTCVEATCSVDESRHFSLKTFTEHFFSFTDCVIEQHVSEKHNNLYKQHISFRFEEEGNWAGKQIMRYAERLHSNKLLESSVVVTHWELS